MKVIVKSRQNQIAFVTFRDSVGYWQGRLIPQYEVAGVQVGAEAEVSAEVLDRGIEYGIDFSTIIGDITIRGADITNAMRSHGIWTLEDLFSKAQEANAACLSVSRMVYGQLVKAARDALGG